MKAAVIYENGDPATLRYEDVADPDCPDDCIVIENEAISIEGGDLLARAEGYLPTVPHVIGYLSAGTVIEVGGGATGISVGDRVVARSEAGSHATRRVVPAGLAWQIPQGLEAEQAACVPIAFGTAHECLFTAGSLTEGQSVLVHAGAGGVGMAAIQLAKQAGATVISTASSDEKLDRLKIFGLDHGINYTSENFVERVNQLTESRGVDIVIDPLGGKILTDSVNVLSYRGTLVSVGAAARAGSAIEAWTLMIRNNTLRSVWLGGATVTEHERVRALTENLLQRVANGELRVEIDRSFSLAEASQAHAFIESRSAFGRVVLKPDLA